MVRERTSDLAGRQDDAAWRVKDDLDRLIRRRLADGPQHALRVVDVDEPDDRKSEQRHGLLAMDQRDHRRTARRR